MLPVLTLMEHLHAYVMMDMMEMDLHVTVREFVIMKTWYYTVLTFILHMFLDINECAQDMDECADDATCFDTDGSYECACDLGFTGNGFNCSSNLIFPTSEYVLLS